MKNHFSWCKNLFCLLLILSFFFFFPHTASAQTDSVADTILQGTAIDLESQKQAVWEGTLLVTFDNNQNFPLDTITKLQVNHKPQGILILPLSEGKTFPNSQQAFQNTAQNSSTFSSHSSGLFLQGNAPLVLQGDTTVNNTVVSLYVNNPTTNVKLTLPTLSSDGTILVDNLSQTITNKTISGVDNSLNNIPNSALSNSVIKIIGGNGISVSDGDPVSLGGTITITNTDSGSASVSGINSQTGNVTISAGGINTVSSNNGVITIAGTEADTLSSVTGRGSTTNTALTLSNASNDITAGTLTATGGTINGVTIGETNPSTGLFTTVNGLTITNNGTNVLNIAGGKTIAISNSLTFVGTDGTTVTFPNISDTLAGVTATQTLTNKTITAGANTISGLTNANLSGLAGITNANLANSSITINAGTGLSGSTTVALGGSATLTNSGVTSLNGTNNQVTASGSTGNITLSLPQNINAGANPTFASVNLSNTSNQLVLGTTNTGTISWSPSVSRILTLPDITDAVVTRTTTDTLTNKTLSAPIINGTVASTGLTLPAFTASGSITGSGSPALTNFGTINGLTLTSASDGLTIAGGTTTRILTLTGADITVGSTIKPTTSGPLTLQSNGANALNLDAGGAAAINIGSISANSITLGADATVSANKSFSITTADKLTVGGNIIPQSLFIPVPLTAAILTQPVFIADTTYQVTGAKCVPSILSASGTFQVTVDTGTQAAGAGTSQLTGTLSLSGTANTVVSGTLINSPTIINAGDRVSAKFGGLLTGLLGNCTIYLKRV